MVAGSSFQNLFGPGPVVPANPSYEALTIAATTTLVWPQETTGGVPFVAQQMDVTASEPNLFLQMPPANTGSCGAIALITNVGTNAFVVTDNAGNQIAILNASQTWLITLTSNGSQAGTWRGYQIGSTTSSAVAAGLAGNGLQANGVALQTSLPPVLVPANALISVGNRATAVTWTGGNGTLQLDQTATLGPGWFCLIRNQGTGTLSLSTSGDLLNGSSSTIAMSPGQSGIVVAGVGNFYTFGALFTTVGITAGGTGATSAPSALVNLGGSTLGIQIFGATSPQAVTSLLGLTNQSLTEATISSNQVLAATSSNTAFVATAPLTLTLPLTTSLTTSFAFAISAAGGAVTVNPQASDRINGGSIGVAETIGSGQSCYFFTDANGNWYTLFGPGLGGTTLNLSGSSTIGGALFVAGESFLEGGASVTGNMVVTGAGSFSSTLSSTGNLSTGASLSVTQNATIGNALAVGGTTTLSGNASVGGTLSVTGATTLTGNVSCSGTLGVTGNTTLGGTLAMTGVITMPNAVYLEWKTATGTAEPVLVMDSGNNVDMFVAGAGSTYWRVLNQAGSTQGIAIDNSGNCYVGNQNAPNPISGANAGWTFLVSGNAVAYSGTGSTLSVGSASGFLVGFWNGTNTEIGSITYAGSTTSYNTSSDRRLKDRREAPVGWARRIILGLRPEWFTWKAHPELAPEPGFFAQQVYRWAPWVVRKGKGKPGRKNFQPWQIDHSKLVPVLVADQQQTIAELEELRETVKQLSRELRKLTRA